MLDGWSEKEKFFILFVLVMWFEFAKDVVEKCLFIDFNFKQLNNFKNWIVNILNTWTF